MIKMVFFAPYPEIRPLIQQVFDERPDKGDFEYEIIQDFFNNPLDNIDADVAVARGFTAHTMQKKGIICAELKVTGYDVIAAIDKCIKMTHSERIAIVGAFNMVYGAENAGPIYPNVKVSGYPMTDETHLEAMVKKAVEDGNTAIVGGYTTVLIAKKYGIPAAMIETGRESINNAIAEAKLVSEVSKREKEHSNRVEGIMNYSFEGILSADKDGQIDFANSYCHTIMSDVKGSFIGHKLTEYFPDVMLDDVIMHGKKVLSELQYYHHTPLLVNCVPIESAHEIAGCVLTFKHAGQIQAEESRIRKKMHESGFKAKYRFQDIIHSSKGMDDVISDALSFSYADSNILISGETGTGKELFAQSIHNSSPRKGKPFVAINCAALPENLLESELFGYVEGAFTGASKGGKMGFFEIAHTGTIFLDEIGDISPQLQSRLLRVLQEKEIIRLGNDTVIPIDVRVISATNKDLKKAVERGEFRKDLLYRLNVLELKLPPLRERGDDITTLLKNFISYERERTGCKLRRIDENAIKSLSAYPWPGNVREMRNFVERLCILTKSEVAKTEDVLRALPDLNATSSRPTAKTMVGQTDEVAYDERSEIVKALALFKGNRKKTAEHLEIDASTLWRKMKRYKIE